MILGRREIKMGDSFHERIGEKARSLREPSLHLPWFIFLFLVLVSPVLLGISRILALLWIFILCVRI